MSDALDAALEYAALGWHVFPCHGIKAEACTCGRACASPGKHPLTSDGVYAATTDPDKIRAWWKRWPFANVGIATGEVSGLFVLDVDSSKGGYDTLADMLKRGTFEHTATVRTGGGGLHILCIHPGWKVKNKVRVGPGLDIRGDGGYIVAPPSLHISGGTYEWMDKTW